MLLVQSPRFLRLKTSVFLDSSPSLFIATLASSPKNNDQDVPMSPPSFAQPTALIHTSKLVNEVTYGLLIAIFPNIFTY